MPRRLKLRPHLPVGEIGRRCRLSPDVVTRDHWQVLWQIQWDGRAERVAWRLGYSAKWVGQLVRRYNESGPDAVGDQRKRNRGAQPLLNAEQCATLTQVLAGPAPNGDLWSGPQVARWMSELLGRPVHPQRGWEYLRRCGYTLQRPRPRHVAADAAAQAAFPKP
jgi:transposase